MASRKAERISLENFAETTTAAVLRAVNAQPKSELARFKGGIIFGIIYMPELRAGLEDRLQQAGK